MSPSVQCLSVRMPRCSFQADSEGTNHLPCYASLQAGIGSIPVGRDPFNSDQAGMPLSLQVILCCKFSLCNNVAIVFNYLLCYQVYSEGKCITLSVIKFNNSDLLQ